MTRFSSRTRRRLGGVGGLLVVSAMVLAGAAFACSPSAQITTRPARGEAGATIDVNGNTFDQGVVRIWFDGPSGAPLAELSASPDGTFIQQVRIPAGAQPGAHSIVATIRSERDGRFYTAPASFVVEGAAAPASPPAQGAPPVDPPRAGLPQTGSSPSGAIQGSGVPAASRVGATTPQPLGGGSPSEGPVGTADGTGSQAQPELGQVAPGAVLAPTDPLPPPAQSGLVQPTTDGQGVRSQRSVDLGGPSPWLLLPLGLIGATLLSLSGASFLQELRERRKAEVEA